ncbi:Major facilitator superfamily domain general substrate transporter [Pyrenophora seminiperda CCB06]|uniref:Major facilitator superfamily domain general substrate transporter n=1 Tax=Pyrenophora seminiperda CCB06 TaxID=1302712 RepID=A0A3M7MCH8_9PLEO|nr:Major facilitator superfamily domain general substrate transporter [Pyrenophora seminiperda CCB06]
MASQSDVDEKHGFADKANSQEEEDDSRPSLASHGEHVQQQAEPARSDEVVAEDKESQIDARSTVTARSAIPPPPDGGVHAWLKVFGGFMIYINIWGFTLSYGVFQSYYRTTLLSDSSPSAISWIGTVQAWLLIVVGVLSGPLFDLGYFRSMLLVGNALVVLGIMMLSLSTQYWQVFLSQGLCMGLGAGLLYIPSLAMVNVWFSRKRAVALGIVMSGIAVGGVIYINMFNQLIHSAGFPWTMRAIGFVALAAALLSIPALLSGSEWLKYKRKRRALFDKSALQDRLFLIFTACSFSTFLGYIVPYFYIPTYAKERLGSSESTALYMLVLSIAGSFFGRLVSGVAAHWLGAIVTWTLCTFASGVLALCWITIEDEKTFIAFSFFSAGLVTVPSAAFANITPDMSRLGTRLGMSWSVSSIASLVGAPIAGALLRKKDGRTDFIGVQVWSGVCLIIGTCWLIVLWTVTTRTQKTGWRV